MDHHAGYPAALRVEHAYCLETGQRERAQAVLDELRRIGEAPQEPPAAENAAPSTPVTRAVPAKRATGRPRKEQ